jgi:hypothetical protein
MREALDEESAQRRRFAEEDFEISLPERRRAEEEAFTARLAATQAEADRQLRETTMKAETVTAAAAAQVQAMTERQASLQAALQDLQTQLGTMVAVTGTEPSS